MTAGYLANGQTCEFKILATKNGENSPFSNVASAKPMPPKPTASSGLTASAGDGKVNLSWTASSSPNVLYMVEQRVSGGTWKRLPLPASCCAMTATYLVNGTTYEFRIFANNISGDSPASNTASGKPLPPFPQPPSGLLATAGYSQITLDWTASPTSNVYYILERRTGTSGSWVKFPYPISTCCRFVDKPLSNGQTYYYRLSANNIRGTSSPSATNFATPYLVMPEPPTNLRTTGVGVHSVSLAWSPSSTTNAAYLIMYRLAGTSAWDQLKYPVPSTSFNVAGAFYDGEVYEFKVVAVTVDMMGQRSQASSSTNIVSEIPKIATSGPSDLVRSRNDSNGADVLAQLDFGSDCGNGIGQWVRCNAKATAVSQSRPMTVGSYLLFPGSAGVLEFDLRCESAKRADLRASGMDWRGQGPNLLLHEGIHSYQWAAVPKASYFVAAYVLLGPGKATNDFEEGAGLYWGGYASVDASQWVYRNRFSC